jgi:glycosyltransferase involved in cell wall biosynthesis
MQAEAEVSIVIPVYNEESVLVPALRALLSDLDRLQCRAEVIVVENGSRDATLARAQELAQEDPRLHVVHTDTPNYGRAMRQGFLSASAEYMVNFSIDFVDLGFLQQALARIATLDMVLGCKYLTKGEDQRPLQRRLAGKALSALARIMFGIPFADTHGLMMLRRETFTGLLQKCRFGNEVFDTELIVRAYGAGLRIAELPVRVEETRPSRLGATRRALRMLRQFASLRMALWRESLA